jgi:hypothetical protein
MAKMSLQTFARQNDRVRNFMKVIIRFQVLIIKFRSAPLRLLVEYGANLAVEGHFMLKSRRDYHERFVKPLGKLVHP